jgi:hypothetical protein
MCELPKFFQNIQNDPPCHGEIIAVKWVNENKFSLNDQ